MPKQIYLNDEAKQALMEGIDQLANAVKVTLGPKGRAVVIDDGEYGHRVTKDGVSVAKEVILEDRIQNLGASMVREAASLSNDLAGDGTTTATVLAQAIVKEGLKFITAGANPMDLKRGIDLATRNLIEKLKDSSIPIDEDYERIKQVASISANNDSFIGSLIADAYKGVGKHGIVYAQKTKGLDTTVDIVKGYKFNKGYASPYFINIKEKKISELKDCDVIIYDGVVKSLGNIPNLKNSSILIIATGFTQKVLADMFLLKGKSNAKEILAVVAPYSNNPKRQSAVLKDLAAITGSSYMSQKAGHTTDTVAQQYVGTCEKVVSTASTTTITSDNKHSERVSKRVMDVLAEREKALTDYEKGIFDERIAKLEAGVAIINVGAPSEVELGEKKDRVDDALHAAKAAIDEGIVIGSGLALIKLSNNIGKSNVHDIQLGIDIVKKAVKQPFIQIMKNAGESYEVILDKILKAKNKNSGYNVKKSNMCDMMIEGIVDPVKVTRFALENAASVAGMILITECALVRTKNESSNILDIM